MYTKELKAFPHWKPNEEAKFHKMPYQVTNQRAKEVYEIFGSSYDGIDQADFQYRFERTKVHFTNQEGIKATNNITLSKPSSDVICVRSENEKVEVCLLLQRRTPYKVEADGKEYIRFFYEHVGGLVEEDETFLEAAIREAEEETGYEVKSIDRLIKPVICKHVSYADESTAMYWAKMGEFKGQHPDEGEDIRTMWCEVEKVEEAFEDYMEGKKEDFFGFDLPEMTILGLQRFFIKLHRKELNI